jgi:hypothetical protein
MPCREPRLTATVQEVLSSHGLWYERSTEVATGNGPAVTFRIEALDSPPLSVMLVVYEEDQLHVSAGELVDVSVKVGHLLRDRADDAVGTVRVFVETFVAAPLRTVTSRWARVVIFEDGSWAGGVCLPFPPLMTRLIRRGPVVAHGPWRKAEPRSRTEQ